MTKQEKDEFRAYCYSVTLNQLDGVIEKEQKLFGSFHKKCAEIAMNVRENRHLACDCGDDAVIYH